MSIERRLRNGRVRWYVRFRDPAGRQRVKVFDRKIDAERHLAAVTVGMAAGEFVDPRSSGITVEELARRWISTQGHLKESTRTRYTSIVRTKVLPRWAYVRIRDVTYGDLSSWLSDLSKQHAAATVRQIHRVVSLMMALAVRDRRLASNPATGVRLPKASSRPKQFLSHSQVSALAVEAGDYGVFIVTLAYTGLRWGEATALTVGDIDFSRRRISVDKAVVDLGGQLITGTPKNHQQRSVPIPRFLAAQLGQHTQDRLPDDLLFTAPKGGPLRLRNFRRNSFDAAAVRAGVSGLTPHELRHTAASLAVSAGASVKGVQRLLGHQSAAMTLDVYSGLFDSDLDLVADRLDEAVRTQDVYPMCTGPADHKAVRSLEMPSEQAF